MKAKLSTNYRNTLNFSQQADARNIIRHLRERANYPNTHKVATAYAERLSLTIDHGRVVCGEPVIRSQVIASNYRPSVGETVCEAVRRGILPVNQQQSETASEPEPENTPQPEPEPEQSEVTPEPETEPEPEPEQQQPETMNTTPKANVFDQWREFVYAMQDHVRRDTEPRETPKDDAGTRAIIDGKNMLLEGIPLRALKDAYTISNNRATREQLGVTEQYDPAEYNGFDHNNGKLRHKAIGYVLALVRAGVPVWLSGPAGSGKSTLAEHVAEEIGHTFRSLSLTSGASPSWILGRVNPVDGFIDSGFGKQYAAGQSYLIDEVANGSADLLTSLNYAIANDAFENPVSGQRVEKGDGFNLMMADNSWGTGDGGGGFKRRALDTAFLDRSRMGRVYIDHDRRITDHIIESAKAEAARLA